MNRKSWSLVIGILVLCFSPLSFGQAAAKLKKALAAAKKKSEEEKQSVEKEAKEKKEKETQVKKTSAEKKSAAKKEQGEKESKEKKEKEAQAKKTSAEKKSAAKKEQEKKDAQEKKEKEEAEAEVVDVEEEEAAEGETGEKEGTAEPEIEVEDVSEEKEKPLEKEDEEPAEEEVVEVVVAEEVVEEPETQKPLSEQEKEKVEVEVVDAEEVPAEEIKKEEEAKVKIDEIEGIDTVDLDEPQGNWLFKRIWWQRSEEKYEKIKMLVSSIFEMRMNFFFKREDFEKKVLNPFYIKSGVNFGELQQRVEMSLETLRQKVARTREQGIRSDLLMAELDEQEKTLQQVQKEVDNIVKLNESLDQAIIKLMEQINRVRSYEQDAWNNFKEISRVLDDRTARNLYFKIEVDLQNIKEIQNYLSNAFSVSFDSIISTVHKQINQIQLMIDALKSKGFFLGEEIKKVEKKPVPVEEEEEEEVQPGFFNRFFISPVVSVVTGVWDGAAWVVRSVWSVITWPVRVVIGGSPEESEIEEAPQKVEIVTEEEDIEG